jgi:uncharacterized protein YdhG (YjbR/CyaY superfamily)
MKKPQSRRRSTAKPPAKQKRGSSKKTAAKRFSAPEQKLPKFASVAEYLARVPEPARSVLNQIRAAIREVVPPDSTEVISYNVPAFKHTRILIWYAAFTHHCSVFPGAAVIDQFKDDLTGYTIAKGTVQFPLDKPLPLELIKKMTQARLEQSEKKAKGMKIVRARRKLLPRIKVGA